MIAKNTSKQAINAVLLHLFRKEEYCKNLQGNMFYNMEVIRTGYGSKASQLQTQYEKVLFIKNRIEALNHLLYGKIWDLYYDFFAAVNRYNNDKTYLDQLKAQRETIDSDIDTARSNKNTAYSNYEDAEAEYRRIRDDYDQQIAAKQSQISTQETVVEQKRVAYENAEHLASLAYSTQQELFTLENATWPSSMPSNPYNVGTVVLSQELVDAGWASYASSTHWIYAGSYQYKVKRTGNGTSLSPYIYNYILEIPGGTELSLAINTSWYKTPLLNDITSWYAELQSFKEDYLDPDNAREEYEYAQALLTQYQNEKAALESAKTSALAAQQAVIDSYWSSYTYWRDEQARLEKLKTDINDLITVYEGVVDEDLTKVQDAADAYNDQLDSMDDKKVQEEGYPELPEPYTREDHEPGPDVPVPDPRPPEEEEDPQDGDGGGSQSD